MALNQVYRDLPLVRSAGSNTSRLRGSCFNILQISENKLESKQLKKSEENHLLLLTAFPTTLSELWNWNIPTLTAKDPTRQTHQHNNQKQRFLDHSLAVQWLMTEEVHWTSFCQVHLTVLQMTRSKRRGTTSQCEAHRQCQCCPKRRMVKECNIINEVRCN